MVESSGDRQQQYAALADVLATEANALYAHASTAEELAGAVEQHKQALDEVAGVLSDAVTRLGQIALGYKEIEDQGEELAGQVELSKGSIEEVLTTLGRMLQASPHPDADSALEAVNAAITSADEGTAKARSLDSNAEEVGTSVTKLREVVEDAVESSAGISNSNDELSGIAMGANESLQEAGGSAALASEYVDGIGRTAT